MSVYGHSLKDISLLNLTHPPGVGSLNTSVSPALTHQLDGGVPGGGDKQLLTSGLAPVQGRGLPGVLLVHLHRRLCQAGM